jgi:hypothetical protein
LPHAIMGTNDSSYCLSIKVEKDSSSIFNYYNKNKNMISSKEHMI